MQVKPLKIRNLSLVCDDVLWQESFGSIFVYLFLLEEGRVFTCLIALKRTWKVRKVEAI